ncbi:ankyrin [Eremomyces bilateralis CBS 781.70]|uniref:Ankyrin n=1 Tax=Eremomyces bilateralis CBS 781.70 TaxID=1392243 RepID=A0A6G1G7U5_9PEZI|nr:ankyrin [Eremomyces bilateralis CBS 781.70]KAF1814072.1 ankyrin [Eremomyces bilateralis CBS 781.70]
MVPSLSEDEIDDILYFSRANETADLEQFLAELAGQKSCTKSELITAAVDEESGNGALHYACANGHIDIVQAVLASFDDSNAPSSAPQNGDSQVSNQSSPAMISYINTKNKSGNTALHWASLNGHLPAVEILLKRKADPTVLNAAGHDAVYEAELNDKGEVVDLLLKEGLGLDTAVKGDEDESDEEEEDAEGMEVDTDDATNAASGS